MIEQYICTKFRCSVDLIKTYKMLKKSSKGLAVTFGFLLLTSAMTSCSRGGYGCPYELKLEIPTPYNLIK